MKRPIYLDHHATTPVDSRVIEAMLPFFAEDFGNASSTTHVYGWRAEAAVELARERIAEAVGAAAASEIVFTSGTTESDNLALIGFARENRKRGNHIVTAATEHPAVLDTCRQLEVEGFEVTVLPVDGDGLLDPGQVADAICDRTLLVSVMAANSEIGVLQPLPAIAEVCREREVVLHSDAAQAVGRIPVSVDALGVDLLSFCAHKLYGPKGVGALYVRKRRPRLRLEPLIHGGGHEGGLRSGTLPVALIVGFAEAVEIAVAAIPEEGPRLAALRDRLWERLAAELDDVVRNGHTTLCLPGNLNVAFPGAAADGVIAKLHGVAISTGSACASGKGEPSHVLRAIGLSDEMARSALRFGLGRSTSAAEIEFVADEVTLQVRLARARPGG